MEWKWEWDSENGQKLYCQRVIPEIILFKCHGGGDGGVAI